MRKFSEEKINVPSLSIYHFASRMNSQSNLHGLEQPGIWDLDRAHAQLQSCGQSGSKRTTERRLHALAILPVELSPSLLQDESGHQPIAQVLQDQLARARAQRKLALFAQLHDLPTGQPCLHANDARGTRLWVVLAAPPTPQSVAHALAQLQAHVGKEIVVFPHAPLVALCRELGLATVNLLAYAASGPALLQPAPPEHRTLPPPRLAQLEAQSIHLLRETVAQAQTPVMLHGLGKDSCVLLHLARKAFFPWAPPFPLLHVDTQWQFRQLYAFRHTVSLCSGLPMLTHINPQAVRMGINPFDHGAELHREIAETEALKQVLSQHRFDVVLTGRRRDEGGARAAERVLTLHGADHGIDPGRQRPTMWDLYNARLRAGDRLRVQPLADWTELDIWQYILQEAIAVAPLYFAAVRPVVERNGTLVVVDDDRMHLQPGEHIEARRVRFRSLGCYPLTPAMESDATTVQDIVAELLHMHSPEHAGRGHHSAADHYF